MEPVDYVFHIDMFTPEDFPMARLAQYLRELASLIGHAEHTHFLRVDAGSVRLVHRVDAVDAPKVATRLDAVRVGEGPKDAVAAHRMLDDLLANDNAAGTLAEAASGRVILPFPGRDRPKPLLFPPFRQDTSIDGQVVNIGGRDATAHATLQDGDVFHGNIIMKRELARELAQLLYDATVRLHGKGRFERLPGGVWKMTEFRVDRWEKLDSSPLKEALASLRGIVSTDFIENGTYHRLPEDRGGGDAME